MFGKCNTAALVCLIFLTAIAKGQDSPFLFTLTPPSPTGPRVHVQYDAAYGRGTFEPLGSDNMEQTLGIRTALSSSMFLTGRVGLATGKVATASSQHIEILAKILATDDNEIDVAVGPGFRHEYSGANVLLARIIVGRRFASSLLYGNLLLEKPFSVGRDDIDLILTAGWSYPVSSTIRIGLEAVGQDLEGLWDENEAEGGAVLFLGPNLVAAIPGTPWAFTLGAGPILRGTRSSRMSTAVRELPLQGNGFVVHAAISAGL
jgi:hypothetical protein